MSIEVKNLTHIYSENTAFEKKAVDDMNFKINKGEFVGLIGHTGSGKSTLVQHLNGLLKPSSGNVYIDGEEIHTNKKTLRAARQKVGLVFQYPEHQLFETTVYKDVAFGPKNMKLSEEEIDRRVKTALALVGVSQELFEKSPFELSGGQKRRVAIAGVLAMEPEVLVMDEPMAGLDPKGRDEILSQIKTLHEKLNNTIIIVSHSMEDISKITDRILVLDKGKLKYEGTPREVFKNAYELEKIGLMAPQISYLIKALNERCFEIKDDIYTVDEALEEISKLLLGAGEAND
ncbi:MAG: energy-coupling factor transporter ATPase [Defluviitaleaceae bacterium]|nr:energy-coupling factor transporter ATPase [Defluviitaleaceae bacterium]